VARDAAGRRGGARGRRGRTVGAYAGGHVRGGPRSQGLHGLTAGRAGARRMAWPASACGVCFGSLGCFATMCWFTALQRRPCKAGESMAHLHLPLRLNSSGAGCAGKLEACLDIQFSRALRRLASLP